MASDDIEKTQIQSADPPNHPNITPEHSSSTVSQAASHAPTPEHPSPGPSSIANSSVAGDDRATLLERARAFLTSPQIRYEEPAEKRRFLVEKGLNAMEIEGLMRELPPQLPPVPPRTYPQPPPSNLPHLLLGLTKIMTWLTGGSVVLILFYYRFLLPRLTRSALARRSLKQHQTSLLSRLNASLSSLKVSQAQTFAVLPTPQTRHESSEFVDIHTLTGLTSKLDGKGETSISNISAFTVLRCLFEELETTGKKPTREELFALLEGRIPWLRTEEGVDYETSLWEMLNMNACFSSSPAEENPTHLVWTYKSPTAPEPTPLSSSLNSLVSSLTLVPQHPQSTNPFQGTIDALADVTGYVTTQTYQLATRGSMRMPGSSGFGLTGSMALGPQEEEIRREIRSLKGLVLNRRTFAPARPTFAQNPV